MPHPGSLLLPFSKICQAFFDADPFPVKVRFLLFQGSRLQNLTPPAFSCFLLKRKCCSASTPPPPPLPPSTSSLGQIWNSSCKILLLSAKSWFQRMKAPLKKEAPSHFVLCYTSLNILYKYTHVNALTNKPMHHIRMRPLSAISGEGARSPATPKSKVPMVPRHVGPLLSQRK